MKRYSGDTILRITYFIYGSDGNIAYSVSGDSLQLSAYIYMNPLLNKLILKNHKEQIAHQIKLIARHTDAIIKKYHYDLDDLRIMISSNMNEPPSFIHFDTDNNIVKKIQYYYDKTDLLKSTESREYEMGRLQKILLETARKKWKETDIVYDSLDNIILEKITSSNGRKNRTVKYKYSNSELVEINTRDIHGNIMKTEKFNDYGYKQVRVIRPCRPNQGSTEKEISYSDEHGNMLKKYQISKNGIHVKERRYTFY